MVLQNMTAEIFFLPFFGEKLEYYYYIKSRAHGADWYKSIKPTQTKEIKKKSENRNTTVMGLNEIQVTLLLDLSFLYLSKSKSRVMD